MNWTGELEQISDYKFRIPKSYKPGMLVDGIIYSSDKLLAGIKNDKAPEQVANVAFLPGIVGNSLAMPDIHWGYGFCIGGVAATDPEKGGVISPGGVGYDINCLCGNTSILNDLGYKIPIKDYKDNFCNETLVCANFDKNKKSSTAITAFLKQKPKGKVYKIKTLSGREIIATKDHPFYTKDGMKEVGKLSTGENVAVYPFEGVEYQMPSSDIIADEQGIREFLVKLSKNCRGNAIPQILKHLRKSKLLPLRYDSPQLPYLIKIMGYCFGDGTIYFANKTGKGSVSFYGEEEDLIDIKRDLKKIGFGSAGIYSRERNHKITTSYSTYEFQRKEYVLRISSSTLAILLGVLGVPIGNKCRNPYSFPQWFHKAALWQKRLFLAAFFGAELSSPKTMTGHGHNFYCPILSMNKQDKYMENGKEFLTAVSLQLSEFGIATYKISKRKEYVNKKGLVSYRLRLMIVGSTENLIRLYSKIGFEYNKKRSFLANYAVQYLKTKGSLIRGRELVAAQAKVLHAEEGLSPTDIFNTFSCFPGINKRFIERSIYGERKTMPRVGESFISFDNFMKKATDGLGKSGMIWDAIKSIEEVKDFRDYVYDFTVYHSHHNFIANNFVVSNCGVRLLKTNLTLEDVKNKISKIVNILYQDTPSGVGSTGDIRVSYQEEKKILLNGAKWAVGRGFGVREDLEYCEESGAIEGADPDAVSERAFKRGKRQAGTLGSGNHFLEVQVVSDIFDKTVSEKLDISIGQVVIMIHSGSRGLGFQVCDDSIRVMLRCLDKYGINLPDRQLACAPVESPEAKEYIGAMRSAANYAWANRQVLMHLVRLSFGKIFSKSWQSLGMDLIYDVAHNIAKFEEYVVDGRKKTLCIHRKGATRALGPGNSQLPPKYRDIGQPVIIPGDMGTASYLLVGTKKAEAETFGSTCFTGDTKVLTDKGIVSLREIYQMYKLGTRFQGASINPCNLNFEWKPIVDVFKREAKTIQVCISQTKRSKVGVLETTPNHKFATFNNLDFIFDDIKNILARNEMVCVLDRIKYFEKHHVPSLAYLAGALFTDGYIYLNDRQGQVTFTQKKTLAKLGFIRHVVSCFQEVFGSELKEKYTKISGGVIRGKQMQGTATDFRCAQKAPATALSGIYENLHTWILSLDEESILNFLAGALDGDGTWNPSRHVLVIFNNDECVVGAIVLACLKLGILPCISKQRKNTYIIQISERRSLIMKYTHRLGAQPRVRKYGSKFFSVRQLFKKEWEIAKLKWPYQPKAERNSLMEAKKILKYLTKSNTKISRQRLDEILASCLRMQRVEKVREEVGKEVYNITVSDNHNYVVFTDNFVPVIVKNCHGAGRVKSRHEAIRTVDLDQLLNELRKKGIEVRATGKNTIVEEAPSAYKDIDQVVDVVEGAGLSRKVARMRPLCVVKG